MDIMEALLKHAIAESMPERYEDNGKAEEALRAFLEREELGFAEGDRIERNELGRKRYKFPGDGQVAVCVKIYPAGKFEDDSNDVNNVLMAVAVAKDMFRYYEVNGAYYRKTGSNTTNVFDFKRKK